MRIIKIQHCASAYITIPVKNRRIIKSNILPPFFAILGGSWFNHEWLAIMTSHNVYYVKYYYLDIINLYFALMH